MNANELIEAMQSGKVLAYPSQNTRNRWRCEVVLDDGQVFPTQMSTLIAAKRAADIHIYEHLTNRVQEYVLAHKDPQIVRRWVVRIK